MDEAGIEVAEVKPGGTGWRAGIRPGHRLVAVEGIRPRDWWEYRFLVSGCRVRLEWGRPEGVACAYLEKAYDDDLGIRFRSPLFDGLRRCANRCLFCFVDQLPPGLRPSLYVKDDDYRLSFAEGNYVTLTNLSPEDIERISRQRMSPLRVSVHATDPEVRRSLMRCPTPGEIMPLLRRLASAGIAMHTQVVLCPGYNDGPILDQTLHDLESLYPAVRSVAVVPVGLTRYRGNAGNGNVSNLRPLTGEEAKTLVEWAARHQRRLRTRTGRGFLYLADEVFLLAKSPFPPAHQYDGFPQLENGVGEAALLYHQWARWKCFLPRRAPRPGVVGLVTSRAGAQVIQPILEDLGRVRGLEIRLFDIPSSFWGENVSVAGLLTGHDLESGLRGVKARAVAGADVLLVPARAVNGRGEFLDGKTLSETSRALNARLVTVPATARGLREAALTLGAANKWQNR